MTDGLLVRDALNSYYREHKLPLDGGASSPWFRVHLGPLSIPLPNPPARRRAVILHDINHLITGYNTTFSDGELSIACFEVGAGCGPFAIAWYLDLSMFAIGLLLQPRASFAAFLRGRQSTSLYTAQRDAETLSAMSIADVRALLQVDMHAAPARLDDRLSFAAWSVIAIVVWLIPWLIPITAAWVLLRMTL